jgi:hypothetical protein
LNKNTNSERKRKTKKEKEKEKEKRKREQRRKTEKNSLTNMGRPKYIRVHRGCAARDKTRR